MHAEEGESTATAIVLVAAPSAPALTEDDDALAVLDDIQTKLVSITEVGAAKECADRAGAIRDYAKRARKSLVVQNGCAFVKVLAERRAGELLLGMDLLRGRPKKTSKTRRLITNLGINYNQSSLWQAMAKVPVEKFEHWRRHCDAREQEYTSAFVWRMMSEMISETDRFDAQGADQSALDTHITLRSLNVLADESLRLANSLQGGRLWGAAFDVFVDPTNVVESKDLLNLIRTFQVIQHEVNVYIEKLRRRAERLPVTWQTQEAGLLATAKPSEPKKRSQRAAAVMPSEMATAG